MHREMALREFAPKTRKVHLAWIVRLSRHSRLSPDQISESQVREYLAGLATCGLSPRRFSRSDAAWGSVEAVQ
jgi:hypothetical protein